MAAERVVHGVGARTDCLHPVASGVGQLPFGEHEVEHPVEEIVLVGDVAVEGHRLEPELFPERRIVSASTPEASASSSAAREDAVSAERDAGFGRMLDEFTLYAYLTP